MTKNAPSHWSDLVLRIAGTFSWIGLAITLMLVVASIWTDAYNHHLSLTDELHVGVGMYGGLNPRLVIFNNDEYGPYRGSIIAFTDSQGNTIGGPIDERYFGDTAGIYYRWFLWPKGPLWTLMISLWYPATFFSVLPSISWIRRQGRGQYRSPYRNDETDQTSTSIST